MLIHSAKLMDRENPKLDQKIPNLGRKSSCNRANWGRYPFGLYRITRAGYRRNRVPLTLIGSLCKPCPREQHSPHVCHSASRSDSSTAGRRQHRYAQHNVLCVRLSLWHPGPSAQWRSALHRRQSGAPAEPRRDLRQGFVGHHEAVLAGTVDQALLPKQYPGVFPRPRTSRSRPFCDCIFVQSTQIF